MGNAQQHHNVEGGAGAGSGPSGAPGKRGGAARSDLKRRKRAATGQKTTDTSLCHHNGTIAAAVSKSNTCQQEPNYRSEQPPQQHATVGRHLPPLVVIDSPKFAAPKSGSESSSVIVGADPEIKDGPQKQRHQADCVTNSASPNVNSAEAGLINKDGSAAGFELNKQPMTEEPGLPVLVKGDHCKGGAGGAATTPEKPKRNLVNRSVSALNMMNSSPGILERLSNITSGGGNGIGSRGLLNQRPQTEKGAGFARQVSVGPVTKSSVEALSFEQYQMGIESQRRKVRQWLDSQPFSEDQKPPADFWTSPSSPSPPPEPVTSVNGMGRQQSAVEQLIGTTHPGRPDKSGDGQSAMAPNEESPLGSRHQAISEAGNEHVAGREEPQLIASGIMANGQTVFSLKEAVDQPATGRGNNNTAASSSTSRQRAPKSEEAQKLQGWEDGALLIDSVTHSGVRGPSGGQEEADTCSLCQYLDSIRATIVRKSSTGSPKEPSPRLACRHEKGSKQANMSHEPGFGMQLDARLIRNNNRNSHELAVAVNDGSPSSSSSSSTRPSSRLRMIGGKGGCRETSAVMQKPTELKVCEQVAALGHTRTSESAHHQLEALVARPASAHSDLCPEPSNADTNHEQDDEDAGQELHDRKHYISNLTDVCALDTLAGSRGDGSQEVAPQGSSLGSRRSPRVSRGQSLDEAMSNKQVVSGGADEQVAPRGPMTKQLVRGRHHLQQHLHRRPESLLGSKLIVINSKNVSYTIQVAVQTPGFQPVANNHLVQGKRVQKLELAKLCQPAATEDVPSIISNPPATTTTTTNKNNNNRNLEAPHEPGRRFLVKKKIATPNLKAHPKRADLTTDSRFGVGKTADGNRIRESRAPLTQSGDNNRTTGAITSESETGCSGLTADCDTLSATASSSATEVSGLDFSEQRAAEPASITMDHAHHVQQMAGFKPVPETLFPEEQAKSCSQAAKRLRELVAHLEHGSVPQSILYQTLEYAASVLDTVTMDQISARASDEEDGDLSEVQSDAVPNEVRKWLETTFTRNSISQKRKSEDKLKFRSVANAIRAGIVVDRIYRRMSASTPFVSAEVSNLLKYIDDWSFNCFSVNQVSGGQVLKSVAYELFNRYGLLYKFKIPTTILKNFLTQVESGYVKHKNPYHNNLHAADVTQTVHYMLWQAGLTNWLTDLEIFATLIAAIIHDYLHTGTTNNFHVMSQSDTALVYNDRAVLENFHICQAFTLMKNEDCNILAGLSKDEYREFRSLVIDMVLATDMSSHFQQIKAMKNILNHSENFNADKSKILSLVIHISDISHPAKDWDLHSNWTQLLMEEFFRQGDREKKLELECSPLCDRETTLVAESQLGFIEFIVSPSLEVCGDVLDRVQYFMAEASARPVLSASAKATPAVLATPASGNQIAAIEPPAAAAAVATPDTATSKQTGSRVSSAPSEKQSPPDTGDTHRKPSSAASSTPSRTSSFVGPTENTLTSNLRKMIATSSATISRKLNISGTSLGGSCSSVGATSSNQASSQATASANKCGSPPAAEPSDFEKRQANYRHPVIKSEPLPATTIGRPKSSLEAPAASGAGSNQLAKPADSQKRISSSALAVTSTGTNKLSGRPTSGAQTASAQHLATKIHRPWIKCLERNKKMWQERALVDAKVRVLKAKQEQSQIEEAPEEEEEEKAAMNNSETRLDT